MTSGKYSDIKSEEPNTKQMHSMMPDIGKDKKNNIV